MEKDYNLEDVFEQMDFQGGFFHNIGNGILLTNREIEILNKFHIKYQNCHSLKEVLSRVEEVLNEMDIVDEELDWVSSSIAERDYYQNTNQ